MMNISSIGNNIATGLTPRPVAAEATATEARQALAPKSSSTSVQTERSVAEAKKTDQTDASPKQLEEAVKAINDFLKPINNSLEFTLDKDSGKTIVKVIDIATKDVIRQFPSEEMLSIAKALDKMKGLLVQQKA